MENRTNYEIIDYILTILLRIMSRRRSESFSFIALAAVIKQLESHYEFLKHIKIYTKLYTEGQSLEKFQIDPAVNTVSPNEVGQALNEIIDIVTRLMEDDADYYFFREVRDALKADYESLFTKFGVNLDSKQSEYIFNRREEKKITVDTINNADVIEIVLRTLFSLLSKNNPIVDSIYILKKAMRKQGGKYPFFRSILIAKTSNPRDMISVETPKEIETILPSTVAKAFEEVIVEIGKTTDVNQNQTYIADFKQLIGKYNQMKLNAIGINLDYIDVFLLKQEQEQVTRKILETLYQLIGENTAKETAQELLGETINKYKDEHTVLQYISIDTAQQADDTECITITPEINTIETYKIGKAFREVIKDITKHLDDPSFIQEFKQILGDEYLADLEKMGINLQFLEFKYVKNKTDQNK